MRKFLLPLSILFIVGLCITASPGYSQIEAHIRIAPPRARIEVRGDRPSVGAVWVGGYHEYDQGTNAYAWRAGRWEEHPPEGHRRWIAPRYRHQHGEYHLVPGRWN
jgi:hypothetical protein